MDSERTVRHFVEDMLSNGRSDVQILTVARSTHWRTSITEIEEILKEFSKIMKKISLF
jgi:hypothetical protein